MQHVTKSNHKIPKGVRLKWTSVKELKTVTVEKINIKGAKVFSEGDSAGKMTSCALKSDNYLIP
ncbi:hypothetical protein [Sphingobacterium faecium]|uniref:hypothetical protein n=1 Tax=Sphingobacterium faecium TaxID=34087 RepID=UPI00320B8DFC